MSALKIKNSIGEWQEVPMIKGDTGNGISSAVLNNDYTLTLTFTDGTTYTTSSIRGEKGEQGEPATDMDIHICSSSEYDSQTRIPTIAQPDSKTFYLVPTSDGTSPDLFTEWVYVNNAWEMFGSMKIDLSGYLTDVTLNGTSVVTDGVAEIPVMNGSTLGVAKIDTSLGIGKSSNNSLQTNPATETELKGGIVSYKPIVPMEQHFSTFYGLAKASGDTTQSASSNAVGNYTNEAKSSIQNMLGITDKYTSKEWIAESETELVTNAHNIGDLFYIGGTLYKVIADLNVGDVINVGVNVEVVNVNDVLNDYATKEDIENNISIVEKSVSGAIASFDDGMDNMPLKSLTVDIDPVQDLHGYDAPYPAGGGKNKLNITATTDTVNGVTLTVNSDGSVVINGTASALTEFVLNDNLNLVEGSVYTLSGSPANSDTTKWKLRVYNSNDYIDSGSGVGFTFASGATVKKCSIVVYSGTQVTNIKLWPMIRLSSVSDSTFAPYSNICPITGWTGVNVMRTGINLFDPTLNDNYGAYNSNSDGTVTVTFNDDEAWTTRRILPLKAGTYSIKMFTDSGYAQIATSEDNYAGRSTINNANLSKIFTLTSDGGIKFKFGLGASSYPVTCGIALSVGSSPASSFVPYQGQTYPIAFPSEAGTVYGGTLDVLSGVLTVDRAMVDLGTLNWEKNTNLQNLFSCVKLSDMKIYANIAVADWISSNYKITSGNTLETTDKSIAMLNLSSIYVNDSAYTDATAEQFKTAMSGVQLVYELVEPIEIHLTPHEVKSLLGQNNIFADTGNTSCEYFSQVDTDLTDYIDINLKSYAKKSELPTIPVSDVQINGNSIINNGTANIPIGNSETYGVFKTNSANGIFSDNGTLAINNASESDIKTGTEELKPVTPNREHTAVFYGLAKVAGDTTQSQSNNAVGTYTSEAKTAIKQMLDIHDTIDSFVENVTGTDVTITGQPSYRYNCGEVYSLTVTPPSSGTIDFRFTSGSTPTVLTLPQTVKMPEWWVEVEANTIYEMCITDGIYCGVMSWAMT